MIKGRWESEQLLNVQDLELNHSWIARLYGFFETFSHTFWAIVGMGGYNLTRGE